MNHVERFKAVMDFRPVDRLPCIEWAGWWHLTVERWQKVDGLSTAPMSAHELRLHLGLDPYEQMWVSPRIPKAPSHGAAVVRTMAEYDRLRDELFPEEPVDLATLRAWKAAHDRGELVVWFTVLGFFWFPRTLFGIEGHLLAFYDEPELMHRMNSDLVAFNLRVIDRITSVLSPEFMTFAEDMSYNHGPMLSRAMFDEFLAPYYRQLIPELKARGIRAFIDSDGFVEPMIPWLESVGFEGILPLERMAGVDVGRIRKNHPRWRMIGGYDKTVMKDGPEAMRAEFARLQPTARTGGYIPSVDHQTPPDVSLSHYAAYVALLHEYAVP